MQPLCIYHGNCADGFGAAWAVWKAHPDWEFYAGFHQQDPPDVTGRLVVFVDFSYKRPVIEKMAEQAKAILILDHHKSAFEDLHEVCHPTPAPMDVGMHGWLPESGLFAEFDMERSGAGMAWDYFHGSQRPKLIDHIEDRDLWRFRLDKTREIQAAVFSYPYTFKTWDWLMSADLGDMAIEGAAIMRKQMKDIDEMIGAALRFMTIDTFLVPVVNAPYMWGSELCHKLCKEPSAAFSAYYWDSDGYRNFGLRSEGEFDVSKVATKFGGGGHRNASGFKIALDQLPPEMT